MKRAVAELGVLLILLSFSTAHASDVKPSVVIGLEEGEEYEEYEEEVEKISDPLQRYNRWAFAFNDKVYFYALKPAARAYGGVVPEAGRRSVRRFFANISTPVRLVNCALQGKMRGAGVELARFAANTTLGVAGFLDPAKSHFKLRPYNEDTDQTLGFHGLGPGFYIVWPLLGPSSARGTLGYVGDTFLDPFSYLLGFWENVGVKTYEAVNDTSLTIGTYEDIKEAAIDPYVSVRNIYFQNRERKVER